MIKFGRLSFAAMAGVVALALALSPAAFARHQGHHHKVSGPDGLSNVTVLIVRHAEQAPSGAGLNAEGQQRAVVYATYFDPFHVDGAALVPARLIATKASKANRRAALTLEPLAHRLNLPVERRWADNRARKLAKSLRKHNKAPVILIAWRHGQIFDLIDALGGHADNVVRSKSWPDGAYDWVVVMRFDARGKLITSESGVVHARLLPADYGPTGK